MNLDRHKTTRFHVGALICILLALLFFWAWDSLKRTAGDIDTISNKVSEMVERRVKALDSYIEIASRQDSRVWLSIPDLPEDMVIYKYVLDTLQSWYNCFPIMDDDIRARMSYPVMSSNDYVPSSPLKDIGPKLRLVNMGDWWYLAKCVEKDNAKIIAGIQLFSGDGNGGSEKNNPHFYIPKQYSLCQITGNSGTSVLYEGDPLFMLQRKTGAEASQMKMGILKWLSLLLLTLAVLLLLAGVRTIRAFLGSIAALSILYATARVFGNQLNGYSPMFSPSLYAGGEIWSSFGNLVSQNWYLFLSVCCLFMVRERIIVATERKWGNKGLKALSMVFFSLAAILGIYISVSLTSLVRNSSISLEPRWFREGVEYTVIALFIYSELVAAVTFLILMARECIDTLKSRERENRRLPARKLVLLALLLSFAFFGISISTDFTKEKSKTAVWANRLALDRDLELELRLRSVEDQILRDSFIAMLSDVENSDEIISNRIAEMYLYHAAADYKVSVLLCKSNDREAMNMFNEKMSGGSPISNGSRIVCKYDNTGRATYIGQFLYASRTRNIIRMLLTIEPKNSREVNGYENVFIKKNSTGDVQIPERYSYATYINGKLAIYKGTYAYPTVLSDQDMEMAENDKNYFRTKGYTHFFYKVDDKEYVVITSSSRGVLLLLSSLLSILAITVVSLLPLIGRNRREERRKNSFRKKINTALTLAIFASLVVLAAISVKFVFDTNLKDTRNMMSNRISTIQTMVQEQAKDASSFEDINNRDFRNAFQNIAETNKTDISIYSPDGKVFISTAPELFESQELPMRINDEAYYCIRYRHQRFHIIKDNYDGTVFYSLYAPVFNSEEKMIAIISSPFTGSLNVMREAIPHAVLMILLVLTLMVVFSSVAASVIDRMLDPLSEVSRKMETAGTHGLEYIIYRPKDELSNLIDSYNRMVHDLSESSRVLAQNEREKAWSAMARQVAHEIKNPLTPIKLEIQRLVRLKQKNDPAWNEKFDKVSNIILEHIDMLTDTANEFSTFAKLYTEKPVEVNLDKIIQDQITIFDNRENIDFTYFGLNDAVTMAPKPQLIRVFVNLLTNSVQAIEIRQQCEAESGQEISRGKISISLRNSSDKGYYEIVFEDNGPGVSKENLSKLFTPSFTTKSSGTGLGLAMCHSIIEKCEGTIRYEKSFTLDGACFIVKLPKKSINQYT